ncbi:MAG TPA: hypothetical protein VFX16_06445 [Pseudonocardiaceae bacterium]|nr:hypothetical protein [Pseudonocardiaceae bacterium]
MNVDLTAPAAAPARTDLPFLRHRTRAAKPERAITMSLDLTPDEPIADRRPGYQPPRIARGERTVLTPTAPMVRLTRLQSGIGLLTFDAVWSAGTADLRLGCAYTLVGGYSSVAQQDGAHTGPMSSRNPVILVRQQRFGRLTVDLRQSRRLVRMVVYSRTERRHAVPRDGNLSIRTIGDARIELPVGGAAPGSVVVLASVYTVDGELVIRSELRSFTGSVRDACRAYGFDGITWLDANTPAN